MYRWGDCFLIGRVCAKPAGIGCGADLQLWEIKKGESYVRDDPYSFGGWSFQADSSAAYYRCACDPCLCAGYSVAAGPDAEKNDSRVVMRFHPTLAPIKAAVLPLSKKLNEGAEKVFAELCKKYNCEFDDRGNIGKRYRRQDEIGTPFCITYDFESEEDGAVTVRDRDTMEQVRIKIDELDAYLADKFTF